MIISTNTNFKIYVLTYYKITIFKGLGVYGSESGSSDESDEEQHISGPKQLKHDSDEAIQVNYIFT